MSDEQKPFNLDFDDDDDSARKRWWPIAGAVVLVLILCGGVYAVIGMMGGTAAPLQPMIQQISIVQPPPPPPPPEIQQPPEPEMEQVVIDEPEPEAPADEPNLDEMLGDELGLDAEGTAGADAFGLRGKLGGRGLVGGDPHAWYAGIIQQDIQSALANNKDLRVGRYSIVVRIWLNARGVIENSELMGSTDDAALDDALERVLSSGLQISREPPEDLPQPIRLRITSRT